ncbi:outer membrane protein OmpK [Pseudoalteromonas sp. SSM20]|uniref:outer membrane protein OmpK n=1 Tax=Pseudoalteromonas sp. SSM20 TaxID=3139394 RepID=UPI003BA9707A
MKTLSLVATLSSLCFSANVAAKTHFSDFSVSYLNGNDYEVGDNKRQVVTLEHFAVTSWGDSFTFVDRLESSNGDKEIYGEFSPRFKITDFENSPVKALYVATTIEYGNFSSHDGFGSSLTNYLYGVGAGINVPYFDYVNVNLYYRNNEHGDNNYQTTITWGLPIGPLYYDGFIDYATSRDNSVSQMNLTSQLKYDVAPHLNLDSKLYVGIEYVHWLDKFGIDGINENNVNLLVKYHF